MREPRSPIWGKLRTYQQESLKRLREGRAEGHMRQILCGPTGSGKTLVSAALMDEARLLGSKTAFVVDRRNLVYQASDALKAEGVPHGVIMAGERDNYRPDELIQVCSAQTLEALGSFPDLKLLIVDECFPGDVEILTDKGFRRFDSIDERTQVAEYSLSDRAISFVVPTEVIRRHHKGDLVRIKCQKLLDIRMTPNHELVIRDINHSDGDYRKIAAGEATLNQFKRLPVAGLGVGERMGLTPLERLLIAAQADGSIHTKLSDDTVTLAFSFSKERKIKRFLEIVEAAGVEWVEVAGKSSDRPNVLPRRRFMVRRMPLDAKHVGKHFALDLMGRDLAAAIIDEMVCWDGHLHSESSYYFSSIDKDAADFYQAVAVLAGYKTNLTIQVDDRKESFSPIHRLFIQKNCGEISGQALGKTVEPFDGEVFCVRVPAGNIVVRSNGKVLVVGNCHGMRKQITEFIQSRERMTTIGLTATPFTKGLATIYSNVVSVVTTNELTPEFLAPLRRYVAKSTIDMEGAKVVAGEWSDKDCTDRGMKIIGDIPEEWVDKTTAEFGGPVKTIAFVPTVAYGAELCQRFQSMGYNFQQISYKDADETRRKELIDEFRKEHSTVVGLVAVDVLSKGFDVKDVKCGISARPFRKSLSQHVQQLGRVMRSAPGKEHAIWLDHAGNLLRFLEDTDRLFAHGVHTLEDSELDTKARPEPNDKAKERLKCSCGFILPPYAEICPSCGTERKRRSNIEVLPGEMILLNGKPTSATGKHAYLANRDHVWRQLVYIGLDKKGGDMELARRFAQAKYMQFYGKFAKKLIANTEPMQPSIELIGKIKSEQIAWAKRRQAA